MHEFPPTPWQCRSWSVDPTSVFLIGVLCVLLLIAVRGPKSSKTLFLWVVVAGFALLLGALWVPNMLNDPMADRNLVRPAVLMSGVVVAMTAVVRSAWKLKHASGTILEAVVTFILLCIGLVMFLPAAYIPREAEWRRQCKNNLKHIGIAMHNYHDMHASFPSASVGEPPVSWRVSLLPYIDQQVVYESFQRELAWNSDQNMSVAKVKIATYDCPTRPTGRDRDDLGRRFTSYVVPTGTGTAFDAGQPATIRSMTDGTTNTFLAMEACGTKIIWTEPRDVGMGVNSVSVNKAVAEIDRSDSMLSSYHTNGAQVLLADGSTRFVSESIDASVLAALLTKAGGEILNPGW